MIKSWSPAFQLPESLKGLRPQYGLVLSSDRVPEKKKDEISDSMYISKKGVRWRGFKGN